MLDMQRLWYWSCLKIDLLKINNLIRMGTNQVWLLFASKWGFECLGFMLKYCTNDQFLRCPTTWSQIFLFLKLFFTKVNTMCAYTCFFWIFVTSDILLSYNLWTVFTMDFFFCFNTNVYVWVRVYIYILIKSTILETLYFYLKLCVIQNKS